MWHLDEEGAEAVRAGDKQRLRAGRVAAINYWAGVHYRGLMHHTLEPFDGRVVLFLPQDDPAKIKRRTLKQWLSTLRQEPEIVKVPGEHKTVIYGRAVAAVGAWLRAEISRWHQDGGAAK
jgi:hypothetical protein